VLVDAYQNAWLGCAYDLCTDMQPSAAMASRRGPIYRAQGVERGKRPQEPPPPPGRDKSGPYRHSVHKSYAHPSGSLRILRRYNVKFQACFRKLLDSFQLLHV